MAVHGGLLLLLLTVPGRRSGALPTVPVVNSDHEGQLQGCGNGLGGSESIPQWFRNLARQAPA